ncbi:hypothetical protein [Dyella jiangningensis]
MSAHTPGPWIDVHRLSGSENHRGYRIASKPSNFYLAEVMPIDSDGIEGGANARLIAAAPDLLSSNERLLNNFRLLLAGKPVRDAAETIAEAEHAIAKATGETP